MTWPIISLFITAVNSPLGVSQRDRQEKREAEAKRRIYLFRMRTLATSICLSFNNQLHGESCAVSERSADL